MLTSFLQPLFMEWMCVDPAGAEHMALKRLAIGESDMLEDQGRLKNALAANSEVENHAPFRSGPLCAGQHRAPGVHRRLVL